VLVSAALNKYISGAGIGGAKTAEVTDNEETDAGIGRDREDKKIAQQE
jgi:hypothetical protein